MESSIWTELSTTTSLAIPALPIYNKDLALDSSVSALSVMIPLESPELLHSGSIDSLNSSSTNFSSSSSETATEITSAIVLQYISPYDSGIMMNGIPVNISSSSQDMGYYPYSPSGGSRSSSSSGGGFSSYRREQQQQQQQQSQHENVFLSTKVRAESFTGGCRVYHAIFGTGKVVVNDGIYLQIQFDDMKYGNMKLKAFHAVPKMVLLSE